MTKTYKASTGNSLKQKLPVTVIFPKEKTQKITSNAEIKTTTKVWRILTSSEYFNIQALFSNRSQLIL